MDTYLGLIGLALAVIGAGGPGLRDRWTGFWVFLAAVGCVLMLGKYTFLFDFVNRIPVVGSSREPVRFHLWVALAVAALAAVGWNDWPVRVSYGSSGPDPGRRADRRLDPDTCLHLHASMDRGGQVEHNLPPGAIAGSGKS